MNCEAVTIPNTKPEHAAVKSNAAALLAPIAEAIEAAENMDRHGV